MKFRTLIALAAAALSTACAKMQEIERIAPAEAQAASGLGKTKTFIYEKAIVRSTAGTSALTLQAGLACVPRAEGVTSDDNYVENSALLENVFKDEFARAGYATLGTVSSGDLFADKRDLAADYRVAAVVTRPKMNVCLPMAGFGKSEGHGEASLTIEWQIYSSQQKAVVYTTQQKGYAKITSNVPQPVRTLWSEAYATAVRGLLADRGFIALVNGAPPASGARTN
jgi:hypothetical protein